MGETWRPAWWLHIFIFSDLPAASWFSRLPGLEMLMEYLPKIGQIFDLCFGQFFVSIFGRSFPHHKWDNILTPTNPWRKNIGISANLLFHVTTVWWNFYQVNFLLFSASRLARPAAPANEIKFSNFLEFIKHERANTQENDAKFPKLNETPLTNSCIWKPGLNSKVSYWSLPKILRKIYQADLGVWILCKWWENMLSSPW